MKHINSTVYSVDSFTSVLNIQYICTYRDMEVTSLNTRTITLHCIFIMKIKSNTTNNELHCIHVTLLYTHIVTVKVLNAS